MPHHLRMLSALVLSACLVAGCARTLENDGGPLGSDSEQPSSLVAASRVDNGPVVVCWGDSLTEGYGSTEAIITTEDPPYDASFQAYPDVLAHFTGLPVYNFGITGALSSEIVSAEGGLVKRESPYGNVSRLMAVAEEGRQHRGDILIAEMGSNGGWSSYDELISQYREMLKYSHCDKYLILGDTDDPGKSSADIDQEPLTNPTDETSWETALREAFGEHFVNLRLYLVNNGLSVSGLQPTTEDLEAMARGNIPPQLRSDYTHFNGYGYYAMARAVYEHGAELGYW